MKNYEDMLKNAEIVINQRFKGIFKATMFLHKPEPNTLGPDLILRVVKSNNAFKNILFEVKANGQPREARQVINQIQKYIHQGYENPYGVMIAPYISDQTAEICREAGIGILDFAGNCRLAFDDVFIETKGASNPFAKGRNLLTLYYPKSTRILRVLLNNAQKNWKMQDLAREANVSLGQVSNVKNLLDSREWVSVTKEGLRLARPKELLEEWAGRYEFNEVNHFERFYTLQSFEESMKKLSGNELGSRILNYSNRFALTGFSGSNLLFPYIRSKTISLYVDDVDFWVPRLGLKRVESGENVFLIRPYDEGVFYGAKNEKGVPVVSTIQLYLDLKTSGGRGEDAAETLLKEVIEKQWQL